MVKSGSMKKRRKRYKGQLEQLIAEQRKDMISNKVWKKSFYKDKMDTRKVTKRF